MIVTDAGSTCRACKKAFIRFRTTQVVCSGKCAQRMKTIAAELAKDERREDRKRREASKPRAKWMAEAQQAFNAWIRARDARLPCVSCGRNHNGQWHAGHYLTTGARPELRFDPRNVHKQCQPCNTHLHGNLVLYRVELIRRIGLEAVEWLEGPHEPAKWSIDELKCVRDGFRIMAKNLKDAEVPS